MKKVDAKMVLVQEKSMNVMLMAIMEAKETSYGDEKVCRSIVDQKMDRTVHCVLKVDISLYNLSKVRVIRLVKKTSISTCYPSLLLWPSCVSYYELMDELLYCLQSETLLEWH